MFDFELVREKSLYDTSKRGRIFLDCLITPMKHPDGSPRGFLVHVREITDRKKAEEERERLIAELQEAMSKVKFLSGMLPICSNCKKVRDDHGYWHQVESYIRDHSEAEFTHGICPECAVKLYPDYFSTDKES